jgi:site-specific DNA-methyltransferase (adenine-specific)
MNPPYGREIGHWVRKAAEQSALGVTTICLLPSRTDTRWWHKYVEPVRLGREPGSVRFLPGRIKFGGAKNSAPFPSVVVIFGATRREPAGEKTQSAA